MFPVGLAVPAIVFGAVGTAGQRCTTTRRVFVHASRAAELERRLVHAYSQVKIGDPLETGTLMGPLIDPRSVESYQAAIGADFHANTFPTIIGDLKFDAIGEWTEERNLYVQYQDVKGNGLDQFKKAGTQVILYPEKYRSGKLRTPFPAAS